MAKISSALEICNLALLRIGHHSISSLEKNNDNDTLQAEACRLCYQQARMSLLSRYNWTFAIKQAKLEIEPSEDSEKIETAYRHQYSLPADLLKLIYVRDNQHNNLIPLSGCRPPYSLESGYLFTDVKPCRIVYVCDTEDIPEFSPLFIDCFVLELAIRLTKVFVDSSTYLQVLQMEFERLIEIAKGSDSQQIILDTIQSYPILQSSFWSI